MFKFWKLLEKREKIFLSFMILFTIFLAVMSIIDKDIMLFLVALLLFSNILAFYVTDVYKIFLDESYEEKEKAINLIESLTNDNIEQQKQITELKRMLSKVKAKKKNKEGK